MTDTGAQVNQLIGTVGPLVDIINREIDLLRSMRPSDIGALQPRKTALIDGYERQIADLGADPALLQTVDPILRDELRTALAELKAVSAKNEAALKAVTTANERLMKAIVEAVRDRTADVQGYTDAGVAPRPTADSAISVRLDQRL